MQITNETKFFIGTLIATICIIGIAMILLSRPSPTYTKEDLIPSDTITKGNPTSSIYLVEFSDFQCPACASFAPIVRQLLDIYGERVVFAYRHFPLDTHAFSVLAAYAAEAAGKQGKFWEMHDLLFERQNDLNDETIQETAHALNLDMDQFTSDIQSEEIKEKITRDKAQARILGINATPTFFLNGQKLTLTSHTALEEAVANAIENNR